MGATVKIAVEAGHEAKWLINRLAEDGFECVNFVQDPVDLHCTFQCRTPTEVEQQSVTELIEDCPEVLLQLNPEYSSGKAKLKVSPHLSQTPLHSPACPDDATRVPEAFRVWVRPLGNAWKLRVQGVESSQWLRNELTHRGLKCSDPSSAADRSMQIFQCMSETPHEACYVWSLLKALPQVLLQNDPA